jgi:hypothetical protein
MDSTLELAAGSVKVKITAPNYRDSIFSLVLADKEKLVKSIRLEYSQAYLDMQKAKHRRWLWIGRGIVGAMALGTAAAGIYYNSEYDKYFNEYQNNKGIGDYADAYNKADAKAKKRNLFYTSAGGLSLLLGVSFVF